jgi:trans-aconitate methyltransferase
VAELYARARPRYPESVIDDVVELGGFVRGSRIVELGCGTGQATAAMAEGGLEITCVEVGPRLAEVARRELAHYPRVQVVNAGFEHWQPEGGPMTGSSRSPRSAGSIPNAAARWRLGRSGRAVRLPS